MRPVDELPYIEHAPKSGGTKRIYADAWVREGVAATATVTAHAVETGAKVSDHYKPDPVTLRCTLFFSEAPIRGDLDPANPGRNQSRPLNVPPYPNNTPLLSPGGLTNAVSSGINALTDAVGLTSSGGPNSYESLRFASPPGRLRTAFALLMQVRQDAELITVGSTIARFESMAIKQINIERGSADGDSGAISLELEQVQFVSTQSADAIPLPLEPRGQIKKDSVTVSAADVPGVKQSLLKGALSSAFGS